MKTIGVIPARYHSSRFPGKPLAMICGKPMVWWVYEQCKKVRELDEIYVATDDARIECVCLQYNMHVLMTSANHPTGTDRVAEVAKRTDGTLYVNIQGDEPLIAPEMIKQVIRIFDDATVYFGTLKEEICDAEEIDAPSTVKVVTDVNGDALYFSRNVIPSNKKDDRMARIYRHIGIYAYKKHFLLKFASMKQTELELGEGIEPLRAMENGYKVRVAETKCSSIGVDYPEHIQLVENIIRNNEGVW